MSKFVVSFSSLNLYLLAALGVAAFFGLSSTGGAQTVPQLLPYTTKVVAGTTTPTGPGATVKANPAAGGACPSGLTATDAYGDGCLATEVIIGTTASPTGVRDAVADSQGNVFFGDYINGIVHRVDVLTGVLSAVAGGATTSPQVGAVCGTGVSTDAKGDGCPGTLVKLSHPTGLVFNPANGDLYIADYGYGEVRKIAATGGLIPAAGGIISLVAGSPGINATTTSGYVGYNVSNATTTVTAATSILDGPYSLSFSTQKNAQGALSGDLFIADEYTAAALVLNTSATSNTVNNVTVPAGTIWKIAGTVPTTGATYPYCVNSTGSTAGCSYNVVYTAGSQANMTPLRTAYAIASAPNGNTYITNEYYDTILQVDPNGVLTNFAGVYNKTGSSTARAAAGSNPIGSPFGVATDAYSNVYFTDAAYGNIWRVDAATKEQFLIASGFGTSGTGGFASATLPGPGIYGISVDPAGNLLFGDTEKGTIGEVSTNTEFGPVGANQPTQTVEIHFGAGDGPAASKPYTITSGVGNFTLGTATCTTNSDNTMDCLLPVTATPSVLGPFSATLTVTGGSGATNNFTLTGTYAQSPLTRTTISYAVPSVSCTGTTTYSTTNPVVITATLTANGPAAPMGTITFFANNVQIGTPQSVTNLGTAAAPVYGATLSNTFTTPNTYTLTAVYSGDSYFKTSTSTGTNVTTASPAFTTSAISYQESSVVAGGTALYSFNVTQQVYAGTVTFACSGLPSNAACVFSPTSVTGTGCSTGNIVALSITTQGGKAAQSAIGLAGTGRWQMLGLIPGLGLALLIGVRGRRTKLRYGQMWMSLALLIGLSSLMACTGSTVNYPSTPKGTSTVTVTATGSTGTTTSFTVPLTVN